MDRAALVQHIRASAIGDDEVITGPFGERRLTYADHTASGRSLSFVEDYIRDVVLPRYANTHTESSATGRHTTALREQARAAIAQAIGADSRTAVIFTGSGSTGAIDKFVRILGLSRGPDAPVATEGRAVVFVGPYEHHSNELLWRESQAEVVRIGADPAGRIDTTHLEFELIRYANRPLRLGSFSAASNVTGQLTDVPAIAELLHRHGALACFDYAAAGSHLPITVGGWPGRPESYLDAAFISPHKFAGGPGTPGILAIARRLVCAPVPTVPGGGTISYVHPNGRHYLDDVTHREEGGTPAIIESIRAGLVFQLKDAVGAPAMVERENHLVRTAIASWSANPAIDILGDRHGERLPIVSFVVRPPGYRQLHHNFVVTLLNDLFGIQCRGGCSCAGPYGHSLLGIDDDRAQALARQAVQGWSGIKPGWARVSFAFYMSDAVADYVIEAVHLVARYGLRLLPWYRFDPRTGEWHHPRAAAPATLDLFGVCEPRRRVPETALATHLDEARAILTAAPAPPPGGEPAALVQDGWGALRWFELPAACLSAPDGTPGHSRREWRHRPRDTGPAMSPSSVN